LIRRAPQDNGARRLIDLTTDAVSRAAFRAPTLCAGEGMFFGRDRLRDAEEACSTDHAEGSPAP
jgi:2-hydroxychromene-2-carboxylate isomerase